MYDDPFYGLSNQDNYFHWNALLETADPLKNLAWKWEIKTYFGLTDDQVTELEQNWQDELNG